MSVEFVHLVEREGCQREVMANMRDNIQKYVAASGALYRVVKPLASPDDVEVVVLETLRLRS
jgi:hypothetical protein